MPEPKRFYPAGQLAAPLVGVVGTDGQGLSGLEYKYNSLLEGKPGQAGGGHGPGRGPDTGRPAAVPGPVRGDDLVLSIDEPLQYDTEQALARAIVAAQAQSGMALIMDSSHRRPAGRGRADHAHAGRPGTMHEPPALPVWFVPPDWCPGTVEPDRNVAAAQPVESPTASAFTDVYEPGSVEKLVTISAALEQRGHNPTEYFPSQRLRRRREHLQRRLGPPHPVLDGLRHPRPFVGYRLHRDRPADGDGLVAPVHQRVWHRGEDRREFPGRVQWLVPGPSQWSGTTIATVPIGQGLAVTAVQMLGRLQRDRQRRHLHPPKLVDGYIDAQGGALFPSAGPTGW